jgi:hypothetical protein
MGGETPELTLEQMHQDASTKKLSECLKRIGDELDSNMELQRCGSPGSRSPSRGLLPFRTQKPPPYTLFQIGTGYPGPTTQRIQDFPAPGPFVVG